MTPSRAGQEDSKHMSYPTPTCVSCPSSARDSEELWLTRHRTRPAGRLVVDHDARIEATPRVTIVAQHAYGGRKWSPQRPLAASHGPRRAASWRRMLPPGHVAIDQQPGRERPPVWV